MMENFYIKELDSISPNGYNITPGGEMGDTFTNNPNLSIIKQKISKSTKKRFENPDERLKISVAIKDKWRDDTYRKLCIAGQKIECRILKKRD